MNTAPDITLCLTMGRRPDLLTRTLTSLGALTAQMPVLAVNDFGDPETNSAFAACCPAGERVDLGRQVGHHPAVDAMYARVQTPYILHFEDDWLFDRTDFLADARRLLDADPRISSVCLRKISDLPLAPEDVARITYHEAAGVAYARLDPLHDQWYGFGFNPHLARKALWSDLGGFASFKRERHISRHLRAQGRFIAYLLPGVCVHIGEDNSVAVPRLPLFTRIKRWLRSQNRAARPPEG